MTRKARREDPVARLQKAARWSTYTNSWSRLVAPGRAPRWVRRTIIAVFVLMAVVGGVVGLIGLLTKRFSATVNRSPVRQPSRGRERDIGEAPLAHLISSAVTRQAKRSLQNPCPERQA